jgi:hypothetical protein
MPARHLALAALCLAALPAAARAATLEASAGIRTQPGASATLTVTLRTMGDTVVATQNDLGFPSQVRIAALPGDKPDCTVNPAIDKDAAVFEFQPPACGGGTPCTAIRAVVVSLVDIEPIPDGAVLYTCRIAVAEDAPLGTYTLTVDEVVLVDEEANELPEAAGSDGSVIVELAPTSTPTQPPTATPSEGPTEPLPTAGPSFTPTREPPPCGGDCDASGTVAINELVIGVSVALGTLPPDACPGLAGADGEVGINDLVAAVNNALAGCPAAQ